jgi:hypothetical protein
MRPLIEDAAVDSRSDVVNLRGIACRGEEIRWRMYGLVTY